MIFKQNLNLLQKRFPELGLRLADCVPSDQVHLQKSRTGQPTAYYEKDSRRIFLHSAYDPVKEGERWAQNAVQFSSAHYVVLGFGLGYHLRELIRQIPKQSTLIVVEPEVSLFRLAMETNPLHEVLEYSGLHLLIGVNPKTLSFGNETWFPEFAINGFTPLRIRSICERNPEYFHYLENNLAQAIQNFQVNQNTRCALSRTFYQNGLNNAGRVAASPGILPWKKQYRNTAAIIVSAGPSLDKNINLLKEASSRALILSTSTAFRPLLENDIVPDFVIAIDPKDVLVESFDVEIPARTLLVFHPFITSSIVNKFEGQRIAVGSDHALIQFLEPYTGQNQSLGTCHSVSHAAIQWAQHLGCNPIILTGQDLALSLDRQHCAHTHQAEQHWLTLQQNQTQTQQEQIRRENSQSALMESKDLFGNQAVTTRSLELFRNWFHETDFNGSSILNATEGGIPIPGIRDLQLKEALSGLSTLERVRSNEPSMSHQRLFPKAPEQWNCVVESFQRYEEQTEHWLREWLEIKQENALQEACTEADAILQTLTEEETIFSILQDYLYPEFLDYNRQSYRLKLEYTSLSDSEYWRKTHQRDAAFIQALHAGCHWLQENLSRLIHSTSAV